MALSVPHGQTPWLTPTTRTPSSKKYSTAKRRPSSSLRNSTIKLNKNEKTKKKRGERQTKPINEQNQLTFPQLVKFLKYQMLVTPTIFVTWWYSVIRKKRGDDDLK